MYAIEWLHEKQIQKESVKYLSYIIIIFIILYIYLFILKEKAYWIMISLQSLNLLKKYRRIWS